MKQGKIVKLVYGRGFGFIHTASQLDLFFHRSALDGVDFDALWEGEVVEFEEGWDPQRDALYAIHVQRPKGSSVSDLPGSVGP